MFVCCTYLSFTCILAIRCDNFLYSKELLFLVDARRRRIKIRVALLKGESFSCGFAENIS